MRSMCMRTKLLSLISIIGAASLCAVQAQSTTTESPTESHSTSKKAASHSESGTKASSKTKSTATTTANPQSRPGTGSSQGTAARTGEQALNPPAPGGGHGQVWVNTETGVYHREGSLFYGTTGKGKYMTEQDAIQAGYKPAAKTR
jgi:cytoskeletal protein RodZ